MRKFAPPDWLLPLYMVYCKLLIFIWVTSSWIVNILAMYSGTMTYVGCKFGSGDMTERAVKFERFPERFCRNRPCFPLSLVQNERIFLFLKSLTGRPGESELIYCAQCDCIKYHALLILFQSSPFSIIVFWILEFNDTISFIFMVKSS